MRVPSPTPTVPYGRLELIKLLGASGSSQAAGHLLTTVIAAQLMLSNGSAVEAACVLLANYLPSAALTAWIGPLIDRYGGRRRTLVALETTGAGFTVASVLAVVAGLSLPLLVLLLAARATTMAATRSGYVRWLKLISPRTQQAVRMKLFTLMVLCAQTVTGVVASLLLLASPEFLNLWLVAINLALYLMAAIGVAALSPLPSTTVTSPLAGVRSPQGTALMLRKIWAATPLRESFLMVVLSQAVFQGAGVGLVIMLPEVAGLGKPGTGMCQAAVGIGLLSGFVIVLACPSLFWSGRACRAVPCMSALAVGTVALLVTTLATGVPLLALSGLALMALAYEVLFLEHQAAFFQASPQHVVGRYQHLLASTGGLLMSLTCLGYAFLCQSWGLACGTLTLLAVAVATGAAITAALMRMRLAVADEE